MEASALQAPATLPQTRVAIGTPLLRFRSDEQLVALFRAGDEEAFRAIHDRYHKRLFAYARQMLPGRQDAEDALQDVFVRAYSGLRASDQQLALRAWLFRVAHNRCVDELRRPAPPAPEVLQLVRSNVHDPLAEVDLRESLRRLIEDIRRLPEQQRSALLMRELGGMSYVDLSASLGISVGAVKSLLVRARVALAQAAEARDTACGLIREQLVEAHDRGMRPNATSRKHMRDCVGCKSFRRELRGMSRQLAAFTPAIGPLAVLAKTLGISGGAGGGAAGGGGLALLGGGGATASAGGVAIGVNHLAALLVAAVATAGGAVEIQHTIIPTSHHRAHAGRAQPGHQPAAGARAHQAPAIQAIVGVVEATVSTAPKLAVTAGAPAGKAAKPKLRHKPTAGGAGMSPSTGASAVSSSSSTDAAATGADGTGTDTSSTAAAGCTTLLASDSTSSGTASPSSASPGSTATPQSPSTSAVSCPATSVSDAAASSTTTGTSAGASGASSASGSSTSASGSGTSQGSGSPTSTGGSSSPTK